jgi:hypothetical protein
MRIPWFKIVGLLLAIWLVVGGAIYWARSLRATPETVMRYLDDHPLSGKTPGNRDDVLKRVAGQLNQFSYEQRREVRVSRKLDAFFKQLSPGEQSRFLDLTLPTGFRRMMESLNKMTPEKRKEFVDKALADMKKHEGEDPQDAHLDENAKKVIDQGFKSFYSDASADVKMDMAPLIEQMQRNMQGSR